VELFTALGNSGADLTNLTLSAAAVTGVNQAAAPYTGSFRPEGNLLEFAGEPVDGTWSLELADRVAGNAGTLVSWGLSVVTEFASTGGPVTLTNVADERAAVSLTVPALSGTVTDLDVRVNADVTEGQTLRLWLLNPAVTTPTLNPTPAGAVQLFDRAPTFARNLANVVFDDQAATAVAAATSVSPLTGAYRPTASMAGLYDQPTDPIAGTWRLLVNNVFGSTTPPRFVVTLRDWGVRLTRDFPAVAQVPLAVPDNGTLTATLPAQLVGGPLQDVGVTLSVTHPDVSQLKAYLTSPAGTKVLLAAGGAGANLSGTAFDDEAATAFAAGTAPYAAAFRPVEPLSRFDGEDGTGNWTLTVQDTAAGGTGSVTGWAVALTAPTRVASVQVPVPVGVQASRTSTVRVGPADGPLSDLDVTVSLTHPATGELTAYLISPAGTKVALTAANTAGANLTNTTFDDEAGTAVAAGAAPYTGRFRPAQPLSAFDGQWPDGLWTLQLDDANTGANSGTLLGWSLSYSTGERFTTTDAAGAYTLAVPAGSFTVREERPGGLTPTQGAAGYAVTVATGTPTFPGSGFGSYATLTAGPALRVNDGGVQRSRVTALTLTAFGPVTGAAAGAFTLTRTGPGGPNTPQPLAATFAAGPNDTTLITLALPAAYLQFGSLIDGAYTLSVDWSQVTAGGPPLGGTSSFALHRLYGDITGDATVNLDDLTEFASAFGTASGEGGYVAAFDFGADGAINLDDLTELASRFGVSV
jgi:subtilisin-like proprotein convertase family protein